MGYRTDGASSREQLFLHDIECAVRDCRGARLMEHRWGRRIAVDIPIRIGLPGGSPSTRARIANFSVTGALIKADFALRVRSRIHIVVDTAPRPAPYCISVEAFVTHNHRHGIGVEWCELASPGVTALMRAAITGGSMNRLAVQ